MGRESRADKGTSLNLNTQFLATRLGTFHVVPLPCLHDLGGFFPEAVRAFRCVVCPFLSELAFFFLFFCFVRAHEKNASLSLLLWSKQPAGEGVRVCLAYGKDAPASSRVMKGLGRGWPYTPDI